MDASPCSRCTTSLGPDRPSSFHPRLARLAPREGPITDEIRELMRHAPVHRPWDCARHPLLLLNAGRDSVVPPHWARDFARTTWEWHSGLHVEHFEYPESNHMMRQQDWDDVWRRALGFLRRNLYRE